MREGWNFVRGDAPTRTMLLMMTAASVFISPFFMIMMPLYSRHVLLIPTGQHGMLMGSSGLGAFTGSLWLLRIAAKHRTAYLRASVAVITLCIGGLSVARNLPQAIGVMVLLTIGTSTVFGLANTIVQERAPDAIRGRVSALAGLSFFGVLPFSGLVMTKFADLVGMRPSMAATAAMYGVASGVLLYRYHCACARAVAVAEPEVPAAA